jgi:hypothetical protein
MMKKKISLLSMLLVLMLTLPAYATASTYYVYQHFGASTWSDASKNYVDDSLMCWAAAASNILAWGGWTTSSATNANQIFNTFKTYWTNGGGNMYYGWSWWLDGTLQPSSTGTSQVNVAGGGNYFSTNIDKYFLWTDNDSGAMSAISYLMQHGYGVTLGVANATISHAITVWGYEYTENSYQGIWITDSDDQKSSMLYYALVNTNGKWYLQNYYGYYDIYIDAVEGLLCNSTSSSSAVPIPAAVFLLGSGLLGLIGIRSKTSSKREFFKVGHMLP